jgi:hypothetical protein
VNVALSPINLFATKYIQKVMSDSTEITDRVINLIEQYIRPTNNLLTMERIHKNVFEEKVEFTRWEHVFNKYRGYDWTSDEIKNFVRISKQIVENSSASISESYFRIIEPDDISVEYVSNELDRTPYKQDAEGEEKEGFVYEVNDGVIEGRYVYVDVETEVYYSGDTEDLVKEGAIEFRLIPEQKLLIVESTRVSDIQKAESYFQKKTNLEIKVCGDLTVYRDTDEPVRRIDSFRESFSESREEADDEPVLLRIDNIQLRDPTVSEDPDDETIEKIDFDGRSLAEHEEVRDYTDDGWIIKGFEAPVFYNGNNYDLKMSGNEVMGYVRIKNVNDFEQGRKLVDKLRHRYLEHIA